ncbi:MAG TPA: PEGA domain-containing protein [Candidatus Saccharimonadales bacterium]|nr:PEGA domain-containing protein [Candidatus Saccharimonadales bacterium]
MDYLDPQKRFRQSVLMFVGYALLAVGITCGTIILILLAYGFGLGKNGQVIQKGVVFVSSQPSPAQINLNGKSIGSTTNTKLLLPAGQYTMQLLKSGYRTWQRSITVEGGDVQHFDYPLLFPQKLVTAPIHTFAAAPSVASQSPDRRWLLVAQPTASGVFDLYDLAATAPEKTVQELALPATTYTKASGTESWQVVAWADDNQHVLIKHTVDSKVEFIELDRADVTQSVNLNSVLAVNAVDISFKNQKFDQFFLYNATDHTVQTDSLTTPTAAPYLTHVLAFQPYGGDTALYVTDADVPTGHVEITMQVGATTYPLRSVLSSSTYLLQAASYNGPLYVVVGSSAENKVYIYKDPVGQINAHPDHAALAMRAMKIAAPSYLAFSATAQFVLTENSASVVIYDLENSRSYTYTLHTPLDVPQTHVTWMDGDRLVYVSGGTLQVVDYDNSNAQGLMKSLPSYQPFFAPDFQHVYVLAPGTTAPAVDLTTTSLIAQP